jgi:hypothetical protein
MSDMLAPSTAASGVIHPPWALFGLALLLVYFVGADEGAMSIVPGVDLHEWVHDGRHLLGFPCH